MTKEVTGCYDCPFFMKTDMWDYCHHPENSEEEIEVFTEDAIPITPNLCPLKLESLTVGFNSTEPGKG